jgi:hypothetical protein
MMTRLAAQVIAVAIAVAPVAQEACRITCASSRLQSSALRASDPHAMHHQSAAAQPSCHDAGSTGQALSPGSTPCDHAAASASASVVTIRADAIASPPVHVVASDRADAARATSMNCTGVFLPADPLQLRLSLTLRI